MLAILACGGGGSADPEPPPPKPSPLDDPAELLAVGLADLSPDTRGALDDAQARFDAITNAEEFYAAWTTAIAAADGTEEAYVAKSGTDKCSEAEDAPLWDHLPSMMRMECHTRDEGFEILLMLGAWQDKARATPEPSDDRFVELLAAAWAGASPSDVPSWLTGDDEFGQCSLLGSNDVVLGILLAADLADAEGPQFAAQTAAIRTDLLDDSFGGAHLPYCMADDLALSRERDRILAETHLDDAQKQQVTEARLKAVVR